MKMDNVYVVADNIFSPLGKTTAENYDALMEGKSGVRKHSNFPGSSSEVYASIFDQEQVDHAEVPADFTRFEKILALSIQAALVASDVDLRDARTVLVISSTKGNINMLEEEQTPEHLRHTVALTTSARKIADWFGHSGTPVIVSNACISGLAALLVGKRLIQAGIADHAVVAGADVITRFVQSGFESFQALSPEVCRPFDKDRKGINLGEAAATIVLSNKAGNNNPPLRLAGGSITNDANHLSGPSRTGEELAIAIRKALKEALVQPGEIGFVSAHGTATLYNDEMEAKAILLAGLTEVPVNSLKGYYGHTLGAAGLVESVITVSSMRENIIFPTYGFQHHGVSAPLHVVKHIEQAEISHALKTASGFGGCNAALVFSKCINH